MQLEKATRTTDSMLVALFKKALSDKQQSTIEGIMKVKPSTKDSIETHLQGIKSLLYGKPIRQGKES